MGGAFAVDVEIGRISPIGSSSVAMENGRASVVTVESGREYEELFFLVGFSMIELVGGPQPRAVVE